MITVNVDISQIKSDITQIHNELYACQNATDTQRRDIVNRVIEKLRTLKTALEENKIVAVVK